MERILPGYLRTHFESIAPKGVTVKVTPHHGGQGYVTPIDSIGLSEQLRKLIVILLELLLFHNVAVEAYQLYALFEKELKSKTILNGIRI